ncbi:Bug family tripartite tricarboxylate transporter substrate binding protein [Paracraurococcus lichenis]|uniref:Tripartite tricarboxylate transporter substrate binding protein n=1 Tax=Paracraurococcus lichenis TaxID=3064888 RepID=A0ABT9EAI5_9PROT|nr:tripartite tricarboxylate transporter substrate binding protein [Paracraurococcus sp. LOR1-02]MDO9713207.1 tripartite tricarboxylate transporter substrate binding protein [Paracraurococcus sp. LOR1-02]
MIRRRPLLAAAAGAVPFGQALAQARPAWTPDRPIRMLVGFSAGGATDTAARVVAQAIAPALGQQVPVENRTGASGNLASEAVARAAPDGYTVLMGGQSTHVLNPLLFQNLTFDVQRDFAPVSLVATIDAVLIVHPSVPARSLAEFIALAKADPGALNAGTAGTGSTQHLVGALFEKLAGVRFTHVAFRGGAPAVQELVAGRIQVVFAPIAEALQQVRAGQARALGVSGPQATIQLPEVPPIGASVPGFQFRSWVSVFAPTGTPPAVVGRLSDEIAKAVRASPVRERLVDLGYEPAGGGPEVLATLLARELREIGGLIREAGITPQ